MLVVLMALYALAHFASALTLGYESLLALRFYGLPHGTYFGIASLVAASLAPERTAYPSGGLCDAWPSGGNLGRRALGLKPWAVARLALQPCFGGRLLPCSLLEHCFLCPKKRHKAALACKASCVPLPISKVSLALGVGAVGFGGLFAIFSYVKPTLMALAGLTDAGVPWMLALLGAGMVVGNLIGSNWPIKLTRYHKRLLTVVNFGLCLLLLERLAPSLGLHHTFLPRHSGGDWPCGASAPDGSGGACANYGRRSQPLRL